MTEPLLSLLAIVAVAADVALSAFTLARLVRWINREGRQ